MLHLQKVAVWDSTLLHCMKYSPAFSGRDEGFLCFLAVPPLRERAPGCHYYRITIGPKAESGIWEKRGEAGGWFRLEGGNRTSVVVQGPLQLHYSPVPCEDKDTWDWKELWVEVSFLHSKFICRSPKFQDLRM